MPFSNFETPDHGWGPVESFCTVDRALVLLPRFAFDNNHWTVNLFAAYFFLFFCFFTFL